MKRILIILSITCSIIAHGQITHTHKLSLGLGNEWNAFLSPSTLVLDDEGFSRAQLWDNGSFQSLSMKNSFKIEGENHRFKIKMNGSLGLYQTKQNSNRYTYRFGVSYRVKYGKRKYLELAPELFRKRREGVNADNAVLTTPFSYVLVKAPLGLDFYLGNKAWLKTQGGYLYKNYDKANGEKLYYHAPFASVSVSKKWESKGFTKKLTLDNTTQFRTYQVRSLIRDEEEDEAFFRDGTRSWTYLFTNLVLDFDKGSHKGKIGFGLYHTSRIDNNKRSTFHEVGPGLQYQIDRSKIALKSSLKYLVRNYERLSPGASNDTPLRYGYLRGNVEVDYFITDKTQIFAKGNFVNRTSNNPDVEARSFREYFNGLIEIGLKLSW